MRGFGPSPGPWLWFKLYRAAWALLVAVFVLMKAAPGNDALARLTVSVGVWISSLLFAGLAGLSLFNSAVRFRRRREVGLIVWYHSLRASIALVPLAVLFASAGLIGPRIWAS